jgi:hypothetical protein
MKNAGRIRIGIKAKTLHLLSKKKKLRNKGRIDKKKESPREQYRKNEMKKLGNKPIEKDKHNERKNKKQRTIKNRKGTIKTKQCSK